LRHDLVCKDIFVQKKPAPLVKEVVPESEIQITPQYVPEVVSGHRCSERSESTADQKWKKLKGFKGQNI